MKISIIGTGNLRRALGLRWTRGIMFLMTNPYMTGHTLVIDGGLVVARPNLASDLWRSLLCEFRSDYEPK